MPRLIIAELHKLATTRLWLWLLLASMALTTLFAVLALAFAGDPDNPTPPLSTEAGQSTIFAVGAGAAGPLVAVLAAIGITGEYRHRLATTTFLATPSRHRVLLAKLLTYPLVGAGYGLLCFAVTTAIALLWLAAEDVEVLSAGKAGTLAGVVTATALFALIGTGLGAALRDQIAAAAGLPIYLFVVEPIITRVPALGSWTSYLPGAAEAALTHVSQGDLRLLDPWLGGIVLAGWGVGLAAAGMLVTQRRDVG